MIAVRLPEGIKDISEKLDNISYSRICLKRGMTEIMPRFNIALRKTPAAPAHFSARFRKFVSRFRAMLADDLPHMRQKLPI